MGCDFGPATKDGQWWRLGTAMFLHFGALHLAMNMLALWDAGRLVERLYGHARFCALYAFAGLGGNLSSLFLRGEDAVSAGASGAIFGTYGALLVALWWQRRLIPREEFRSLFWGGASFAVAIMVLGQFVPRIDNAAHVGGFLVGAVSALALWPSRAVATPMPKMPRWGALAALAVTVPVMIASIPGPRYRWTEEINAREAIHQFLVTDQAVSQTWQRLMEDPTMGQQVASFSQLAGAIETQVADRYEETFEQLSQVHLDPAAPSAGMLARVRRYAELRRESARTMVEGLRSQDGSKISRAVDLAGQSRTLVPQGMGDTAARGETARPR